MQLVVFVGPKGCGKDTAADFLRDQKKVIQNIPFALPLKRICAEVFDIPLGLFKDPDLKDKPLKEPLKIIIKHLRKLKEKMLEYVDPYEEGKYHNLNKIPANLFVGTTYTTPREVLQQIGTNLIREHVSPKWHCMAAFGEHNIAKMGINPRLSYAVTDCRFVNEYEYLKSNFPNAYFYYVERPQAERTLDQASHVSETEVRKVRDLLLNDGGEILNNSGSLDDFRKLIEKLKIENRESTGSEESWSSRFRFAKRG